MLLVLNKNREHYTIKYIKLEYWIFIRIHLLISGLSDNMWYYPLVSSH